MTFPVSESLGDGKLVVFSSKGFPLPEGCNKPVWGSGSRYPNRHCRLPLV